MDGRGLAGALHVSIGANNKNLATANRSRNAGCHSSVLSTSADTSVGPAQPPGRGLFFEIL